MSLVNPIQTRTVRLGPARVEANAERMRLSYPQRYAAWLRHHENLEATRAYPLPKLREFYPRASITTAEREALHVTRRAIESLTSKSFVGTQGQVAEWSQVMDAIGLDSERDSVIGQQSLTACVKIMRASSYDIPLGKYSFIRTPLALPALERKYYLTDLLTY